MNSDGEIKSFVDKCSAKKAGFDVSLTDKEASVLKKKSKAKRVSFYEHEKIRIKKMSVFNKAVAYKAKKDKLHKRKRNKLAKISKKINRR